VAPVRNFACFNTWKKENSPNIKKNNFFFFFFAGRLTPVILANQEAEFRRIAIQSQFEQIFMKPHLEKNPSQKSAWCNGSSGRVPA
jgi:hypothetical protein